MADDLPIAGGGDDDEDSFNYGAWSWKELEAIELSKPWIMVVGPSTPTGFRQGIVNRLVETFAGDTKEILTWKQVYCFSRLSPESEHHFFPAYLPEEKSLDKCLKWMSMLTWLKSGWKAPSAPLWKPVPRVILLEHFDTKDYHHVSFGPFMLAAANLGCAVVQIHEDVPPNNSLKYARLAFVNPVRSPATQFYKTHQIWFRNLTKANVLADVLSKLDAADAPTWWVVNATHRPRPCYLMSPEAPEPESEPEPEQLASLSESMSMSVSAPTPAPAPMRADADAAMSAGAPAG